MLLGYNLINMLDVHGESVGDKNGCTEVFVPQISGRCVLLTTSENHSGNAFELSSFFTCSIPGEWSSMEINIQLWINILITQCTCKFSFLLSFSPEN